MNTEDKIQPTERVTRQVHILNPPECRMLFFKNEKMIGILDWTDGPMTFQGDADESARMLIDNVIDYYNVEYAIPTKKTQNKT